jgi:hypothetical protein
MISSLKLFHQDGEANVASFSSPSVYEDGRLRNLPAGHVFRQNPDVLPAEQTLPLAEAVQRVSFTPEFLSQLTPPPAPVRLAQLVEEISASSELSSGRVRTILLEMLSQFAGLIESETGFTSPVLGFTSMTLPGVPAQDDRPARTPRKLARLFIQTQPARQDP